MYSNSDLIADIDRHLNITGADQLLTPEDKNLIRLQHNKEEDLDKYGSQDDIAAPQAEMIVEESRPLTADELLDLEAEAAFSRGRDAELIDDDWNIDLQKRRSTIRGASESRRPSSVIIPPTPEKSAPAPEASIVEEEALSALTATETTKTDTKDEHL